MSNLDENLNVLNKEALLGKTIELQKKTLLDENYFEEEDDEWDNDVEGLSIQAVELILTILNKHDIQSLIFCGLYPLCNTITNLLLISKQQVSFILFKFLKLIILIPLIRKTNGYLNLTNSSLMKKMKLM